MAAGSDPLMGSVDLWAPNFAPRDWALCAGQLFSIAQYSALFALLGTTYGGDGKTTFALPDMRGRIPIGVGNGPGLSDYILGQKSGSENVTLTLAQMPMHTHPATGTVTPSAGTGKITLSNDPTSNYMGQTPSTNVYTSSNNAAMGSSPLNIQIGLSGSGQPFNILQPYLCLNYIICISGVFPSRN